MIRNKETQFVKRLLNFVLTLQGRYSGVQVVLYLFDFGKSLFVENIKDQTTCIIIVMLYLYFTDNNVIFYVGQ
jgi:hypothetical protein